MYNILKATNADTNFAQLDEQTLNSWQKCAYVQKDLPPILIYLTTIQWLQAVTSMYIYLSTTTS